MADNKREYGALDPNTERTREVGAAITPSELTKAQDKSVLKGLRDNDRVRSYSSGGMVKHGSPKVSAKCADTKVIKCS